MPLGGTATQCHPTQTSKHSLAAKERYDKLKARGRRPSDGTDLVLRAYGVLMGIIDLAVDRKRLPKNAIRGQIDLPKKGKKRKIYLKNPDVTRLVSHCGQHRVLVMVLAYCGLRWSEAIGLKVSKVDFDRARIHVDWVAVQLGTDRFVEKEPKNYEIRDVPVPLFVLNELREWIKGKHPDDLVFPDLKDPTAFLRRPQADHGWFVKAVRLAKVQRITPHDLRHTRARR